LAKAQQKLDELNAALEKLKKAEADLAKSEEELKIAIADTKVYFFIVNGFVLFVFFSIFCCF
jgi:hypothetical protein